MGVEVGNARTLLALALARLDNDQVAEASGLLEGAAALLRDGPASKRTAAASLGGAAPKAKRRAWTPAQKKAAAARMKAWHAANKKGR